MAVDVKEIAKGIGAALAIIGITGAGAAGTYLAVKECKDDLDNGKIGKAAFDAAVAGSCACIAGFGIKCYNMAALPDVIGITPELADSINKVTEAAKSLTN